MIPSSRHVLKIHDCPVSLPEQNLKTIRLLTLSAFVFPVFHKLIHTCFVPEKPRFLQRALRSDTVSNGLFLNLQRHIADLGGGATFQLRQTLKRLPQELLKILQHNEIKGFISGHAHMLTTSI
ncbi:hypothetical protein AM379_19835 [Enterobacter cloacae complex sp. FDA-CDC-AR_0132]|nr:hypothetical protein AM379_19835 [Enterobacter cloacae complex sp. FDA-CDC-AR_0132]